MEIITNADYGNSYPPKIELTEETTAGEINIDVETISERDNYTLNVKNGLTVEGDAVMRINAVGEDGTDGGGGVTAAMHTKSSGISTSKVYLCGKSRIEQGSRRRPAGTGFRNDAT